MSGSLPGGYVSAADPIFSIRAWPVVDAPVTRLKCFSPHAAEVQVLNRTDRSSPMAGEAEVKYLDGDFRVLRPGAFVRCAVTGLPIPLEELKYWSVDLQEAYANPEMVLMRHLPAAGRRGKEDR
jgi:hypothetical protein